MKLTSYLTVRVTPSLQKKFMAKAKKYGQPSDNDIWILSVLSVVPKEQLFNK